MRTNWEASRQGWEIFIDDPDDEALDEFGFPAEARTWLLHPARWFSGWDAVGTVSSVLFARLHQFLRAEQVQVLCLADAADTRRGKFPDVVRRGFAHCALLGPDWTDLKAQRSDVVPEWVWSLAQPLQPTCEATPPWEAFTNTSDAFRRACECLSGVRLGGVSLGGPPVIRPCASWPGSGGRLPAGERTGLLRSLPGLEDARIWTLQVNYYGVATHLISPGSVARTDGDGRVRVLSSSPESWLASELEGGTRGQPHRADLETG